MMNDIVDTKKIMLMGLDNSGKTSILFNLKKGTNILSLYSMVPTHGLAVVNFREKDIKYYVWDFGGQERYRTEFLKNMQEYTLEVDELIFVIDIQAMDRYEEALKYLQNVVNELKKLEESVQISIYLHKYSPDLEENENYSPANIKINLLDKIQEIIGDKFKYQVYKTRVYTLFERVPL